MTEVRCDACGRREPGSREDPPEHWAAYRLQAVSDDPDMGEVTLLACSWQCLVERCQVIIEMTRCVFEVYGGIGDEPA